MTNLIQDSSALRSQVPTILTYTSPEDTIDEILKREEFRREVQKDMDKLSDAVSNKKNEIRRLQSEIETIQQDKRLLASVKADQELDIEKLNAAKWSLIHERKTLNL